MELFFPLAAVTILSAIVFQFAALRWDRQRIARHLRHRGAMLLTAQCVPDGTEHFGDDRASFFFVRYLDANGHEHRADCQTSLWTREVRFVADRIISYRGQCLSVDGAGSEFFVPARDQRESTPNQTVDQKNRRPRIETERVRQLAA